MDSNTITVKWQLPQSTGHLHKINMQLYDHNADITLTNKTVNGRLTSYTMTIVSPQQCFPHSCKVRCEYKDRGWSDFTKQVFWFPGKFCWYVMKKSYFHCRDQRPVACQVCQWLAVGLWFYLGTPVFSSNKTDRHDITEILLKVAFYNINLFSCSLWYIKYNVL